MTQDKNMSTGFRTALKGELSSWVQEGILTNETAKHLSEKYQLDNLKTESSRLLSAVIFTLGSLLLGGGVITFVAANWRGISVPVKLALLFSALLGFHIFGYWLWHARGWDKLGHSLIKGFLIKINLQTRLQTVIFQSFFNKEKAREKQLICNLVKQMIEAFSRNYKIQKAWI